MAQLGFFVSPEDEVSVRDVEYDNTPIPEGWYDSEIRAADILPTKSGGHRINIRYGINGPTYSGRVVFGSVNIDHSNPKVVEIGKEQLVHIARAIGKKIGDTDDLIGHSLRIKVKINKTEGYKDSNDVIGWQAPLGGAAPSASAPKATGSTPPWMKK